jgi:hypothetical protein
LTDPPFTPELDMPRLAPLGVVAVAALLLPLVACKPTESPSSFILGKSPPITVDIKCETGVSVGLTDASGNSAWVFEAHQKDPIEWQVQDNITSIDISPKSAGEWPLADAKPHGHGKANPAKSKVKDDAKIDHTYHYRIDAVCRRANGTTVNVTLDPDIFVW